MIRYSNTLDYVTPSFIIECYSLLFFGRKTSIDFLV